MSQIIGEQNISNDSAAKSCRVTILFLISCILVQILDYLTGGTSTGLLFMVYRPEQWDFFAVLRLFFHVLGHAGWDHLISNMIPLAVIGCNVERRYGSAPVFIMILVTALVTGLFSIIVYPDIYLLGASGVVFALWGVAALTNFKEKTMSPWYSVIAILYLLEEFVRGVAANDGIAHYAHLLGGVIGVCTGIILQKKEKEQKESPSGENPC